MIEAELLNLLAANAIDPAVADVADPSPLWAEEQGGAGGAYAGELLVLLAAAMNTGVGFVESLAQRGTRTFAGIFVVSVRNDA